MMLLKKKGTCTFSSFPPTSKPSATRTRVLVPMSPLGQMLGISFLIMSQSCRDCSFSLTMLSRLTSGGFAGLAGAVAAAAVVLTVAGVDGSAVSAPDRFSSLCDSCS